MLHIRSEDLKSLYKKSLSEYPFESHEEAASLGISSPLIENADTFTALESPFTFREHKIKQGDTIQTSFVYEESTSSCVSSDDNPFYGDIKMNMDLTINGNVIVDNCEVTLVQNCKYGLVGRNGIGKTTLLKAIRKRQFGISKSLKIHMIKQDYTSEEKVIDFVSGCSSKPENSDSEFIDAGKILTNLGFSQNMLQRKISELSGGWRMRAQLAKAVSVNPGLLLLDEPTNFLDIKAIAWLEKQVPNLKTVIIVSHDREFLNSTVDHILHLNNMKLDLYKGNYQSFKNQIENNLARQIKLYNNQQAEISHLTKFINKNRASAALSTQAQSRIKLLNKIELIEMPYIEPKMKFKFETTDVKGVIIELERCKFSYQKQIEGEESNQNWLFDDLSLRITNKSRIVLVGDNGQGKSTLLKILSSKLNPIGNITKNGNLSVGYFAQHHLDHLDHNQYTLSLLMQKFGEEESRAALSNFGLKVNNQKIGTLSGGQKSRLAFALISLSKPNLLVLDEPTNHLDMETIDALCDALNNFQGAVIAVSHDLAFIESVFNEVVICEDKCLKSYKGNVCDYKAELKKH